MGLDRRSGPRRFVLSSRARKNTSATRRDVLHERQNNKYTAWVLFRKFIVFGNGYWYFSTILFVTVPGKYRVSTELFLRTVKGT